ncbi:MAG TPA: glycosyltransferase family A protein [Kofleriaceae bacterium]|nr:glycosyltransferase family A protein [Kofleriaceae bacterium]
MTAEITVILSSWKRPHNLVDQVAAMRAQTLPPREIWLWADTCDANRDADHDALGLDRIFRNSSNLGVYGRFAVGLLARTRYVAVFDDDTIPGRRYLERCAETIEQHHGIVAAAGVQFLQASYRPAQRYGWAVRTPVVTEVDVGCNAWFLERAWLAYLWLEPPFHWNNGEDMRLSYLAQKHGGIRTFVPAQADEDCVASLRPELGRDAVAISAGDEHYRVRTEQLIEQLRHGWRTVRSITL